MNQIRMAREMACFLPVLEQPGFTAGAWVTPPTSGSGAMQMPYVQYGETAFTFMQAADDLGWMLKQFDWGQWAQTVEARRLRDDRSALAQATLLQLQKLLTVCLRQERFADGALLDAFGTGLILGIVRRAAAICEADERGRDERPPMTVEQAARALSSSYHAASENEKSVSVHLFGIGFADDLKSLPLKEVVGKSGIPAPYATEIRKATNLARYVQVREETAITTLTFRFDQALAFASSLHRGQVRKGTDIPYIAHLIAVAAIVIENGGNEAAAIGGLLHDAAEDQGGRPTLDLICSMFGEDVARIVEDCTDAWEEPKPDWRLRKEQYISSLEHKQPASLLVSLADKHHNLAAIRADYEQHEEALWQRFSGGRDTLWYYDELSKVFSRRLPCRLSATFAESVADLLRAAT